MRTLLLALLAALPAALVSSALAGDLDLEYGLTFASAEPLPPRIAITLRCRGDADGTTDLSVEKEWGGHTNDGRDVGELRVVDAAGTPLPVVRRDPNAWTVTAPPGEALTVEYVITETPPRGDELVSGKAPGNDYRTRLDRSLFQSILHFSLLVPDHLRDERERPVAIIVDGFAKAGWSVMSSFGPGEGRFERRLSTGELCNSLVIAAREGAARFHRRSIGANEIGVAIVAAKEGEGWGFEDNRFVDLARSIVAMERDFFADHSDPWFLITLTPEGGRAQGGSFSLGGTGLHGAFALYCNTGLSLDRGSPLAEQILFLLAHEYFHTWNGTKISITDGKGRDAAFGAMWFSEGFTNHYARKLLHRAGLIDDAAFAAKLNEALAGLDANPHRGAPNEAIDARFWTDRDLGQLPYQRGDLVALAVDESIRARSKGARSLDDVMRELFVAAGDGKPVSDAELLARIERELEPAAGASLRAALLDGKPIDLPTTLAHPALRLVAKAIRTSDPGFDLAVARTRGEVSGVREGTAAWSAGLRDGQRLHSFTINGGADLAAPPRAVVDVEIDGKVTRLEYEALSEPRQVRLYEPAHTATNEAPRAEERR